MGNESKMPNIVTTLTDSRKKAVTLGCMLLMLSIGMLGIVFGTLASPILKSINAPGYVSLYGIAGTLGIAVMTPVGGKLGDIIGRRSLVVIPGIICVLSVIIFTFMTSLVPLIAVRFLLGFAQGAFSSAPFIIVSIINEKKDIPRAMGLLATAISVGSFAGGYLAGWLADQGLLKLAMLTPNIPLIIGIILIWANYPNDKRKGKIYIDVPGIAALLVWLTCLLLALNFGSSLGWGNIFVILGLIASVAALITLIKIEGRAKDPLIPLRLFKNKQYAFILIGGFAGMMYVPAMNIYAAYGALNVIGTSTRVAGSLQMPRTLILIFLPTLTGIWLGKDITNAWKAMAISTVCVAVGMAAMGFTSPDMSILVYFAGLALTGIAESFRSTSVAPAAQRTLSPEDLGIGTALCNSINPMAITIGNALFGVSYNAHTASDPTSTVLIQNGVNSVFRAAAVMALIGLVLVIFIVRPQMTKAADTAGEA